MIVMIGGIKGGTGKSTIATNLAAYMANNGADVLLLDVDPQATAYKWAMRRQENYADAPTVHKSQASGRVFDVIRDVSNRYEHIVIDSGGHASDAMKSGMLAAHKLYVPLRPSQADLETVGEMTNLLADVKAFNERLQAFSLISMASTNPAVIEAQEAREALQEVPGLALSDQLIFDRKIYRDAFFEGVGVIEMTTNKGTAEIQLLAQEVLDGQSA
jgi:chromosome partitioning protein